MTQEKSMLCYILMTRNSRLGQIDRKSHVFGKAFCQQFSPFDTKGSQHSGLYGNRMVWRWWRTAQTPSLGWSCAYKTWYGVASAASEPVGFWLEKSCDFPSVTLGMWAGFQCIVCVPFYVWFRESMYCLHSIYEAPVLQAYLQAQNPDSFAQLMPGNFHS